MRVIREADGRVAYFGTLDENEAIIRLRVAESTPEERLATLEAIRSGK
jgi:hypothetical protein